MKTLWSIYTVSLLLVLLSMQQQRLIVTAGNDGEKLFIHSFVKKAEAGPESRLEFFDKDKKLLCTLDYSSKDGEHGYGVKKAVTTIDNKYVVVSLINSGRYQSWHSPAIAYSSEKKWIISLDDFIEGTGISGSEFELTAPHNVATHMRKDQEIPITLNLDDLFRSAVSAKVAKGFSCSAGTVHKMQSRF